MTFRGEAVDDPNDAPTEVGCWAHARRRHWEAAIVGYPVGREGLLRIRKLHELEAKSHCHFTTPAVARVCDEIDAPIRASGQRRRASTDATPVGAQNSPVAQVLAHDAHVLGLVRSASQPLLGSPSQSE